MGIKGILTFFYTHKCNQFCEKLGLIHPLFNSTLPNNFSFFYDTAKLPDDPNKLVWKLCSLCEEKF